MDALPDPDQVPDYNAEFDLTGRNLVVVGAGQGIGRQVCHALSQSGASVVCVDLDADRAQRVAEEVGGHALVGDATKREDVERLVPEATAAVGGRIHGFVDIIGLAAYGGVLDIDDATIDSQIDLSLRHAILCGQVFGRHFVDEGGSGTMTFIASVSGMSAAPRHGVYGAAKAGLMSWIKTLSEELGPHGIRANAVAPGATLTPRLIELLDDQGMAQNRAESPLGTMVLPSSIAAAVRFLASDAARHVTGETLTVDAGVTAKFPYRTTP